MLRPDLLRAYNPKVGEKIRLSAEAQKIMSELIYTYKQLFYGLRRVVWVNRDKKAVFFEALASGELEEFKIAPGRRLPDGSYSRGEWDYDGLNLYLWQSFTERFEEAFSIEKISELKTVKDISECTKQLLEFTLENWGELLLKGQLLDAEDEPEAHQRNLELMKQKLLQINHDYWEERKSDRKPDRKQQKAIEAAHWLANHPEFSEDTAF